MALCKVICGQTLSEIGSISQIEPIYSHFWIGAVFAVGYAVAFVIFPGTILLLGQV
jgi:hypothetical protein